MKFLPSFFFIIATFADPTFGTKYETGCEMLNELVSKQNRNKTEAEKLVCIAQFSSGMDSSMIMTINISTKSNEIIQKYHGIFQASEGDMCFGNDTAGGFCNATCEAMRNDDITESVKCAEKYFSVNGYSPAMINTCQSQNITRSCNSDKWTPITDDDLKAALEQN